MINFLNYIIFKIKETIFKIKDYDRLEHDYSCCLCYFTNNRLSKTNYEINGLLTVICDTIGDYIDKGYNHAKEELDLTWKDILLINKLNREVIEEQTSSNEEDNSYSEEEICKEVLNRFNKQRESDKQ